MVINLTVSFLHLYYSYDAQKTGFTEDEVKAFDKNDYVKIKWMDGTETPVTGEVSYSSAADDPNNSINSVFINFDEKIDYKQIQSVIVGDIEFTDGFFFKY